MSLTLRQEDNFIAIAEEHLSKGRLLYKPNWWRVLVFGKPITTRNGTHQWKSAQTALSAFRAYVRNDWVLLDKYHVNRGVITNWNELRYNASETANAICALLEKRGLVNVVQNPA
jgi:hypothetical protein